MDTSVLGSGSSSGVDVLAKHESTEHCALIPVRSVSLPAVATCFDLNVLDGLEHPCVEVHLIVGVGHATRA